MADVTDAAFRRIIAKYGKPDVMFTEFTSADGLCSEEGRKALLVNLKFSEEERPIVAQLFSSRPEKMFEAAKLVRKLGFNGLDINMGCPDRSIEKSGAGAALIKNPKLARELIRAAKEGVSAGGGADAAARPIPVSVKTRLGYNRNELKTWLPELLAEEPAAVTIHARTRKEMSKAAAHWEEIRRAVEIRDALKSKTLILGNGDVADLKDARAKARASGADGVMLGRAIFGNPFLFNQTKQIADLSVAERLKVMLEHVELFELLFGKRKNFAIMKKHFKAYVSGWDGAKDLRANLMESKDAADARSITVRYFGGS